MQPSGESKVRSRFGLTNTIWLIVLFMPSLVLFIASLRLQTSFTPLLYLGTVFQVLGATLALTSRQTWTDLIGTPTIMLYVIALSWLVMAGSGQTDWYYHVALAFLLVTPLILFAAHCLDRSGAIMYRRARHLADRLARRRTWPTDLMECRDLSEVKALRENLHLDASPVLQLLNHSSVQVRVAALATMEFRQSWRPGQTEIVLHTARTAREPVVRATAVLALANTEERQMLEALAEFLWDPSQVVRHAARDGLLWNLEQRWPWIRLLCRQAMSHPATQQDGPLCRENQLFPDEVVSDLFAWSADKGLLALRAASTLAAHYHHVLTLQNNPALPEELRQLVMSPKTPALLRIELTRLLHQHRELDEQTAWKLLDSAMPGPARLLAAEILLAAGHTAEIVLVLRDLARVPNREIALLVADVVQRCLGVELGLLRDQELPPVQSRTALEVVRRLLAWSAKPAMSVSVPHAMN